MLKARSIHRSQWLNCVSFYHKLKKKPTHCAFFYLVDLHSVTWWSQRCDERDKTLEEHKKYSLSIYLNYAVDAAIAWICLTPLVVSNKGDNYWLSSTGWGRVGVGVKVSFIWQMSGWKAHHSTYTFSRSLSHFPEWVFDSSIWLSWHDYWVFEYDWKISPFPKFGAFVKSVRTGFRTQYLELGTTRQYPSHL